MSPRIARRMHVIGDALRNLGGGLLMAGGFVAILWLAELAFVP